MSYTIVTEDCGWDLVFAGRGERGPAHVLRSTTSSRRPGKAIEGMVVSRAGVRVATCGACGGLFYDFGAGRHYVYLDSPRGRVVLCSGAAAP